MLPKNADNPRHGFCCNNSHGLELRDSASNQNCTLETTVCMQIQPCATQSNTVLTEPPRSNCRSPGANTFLIVKRAKEHTSRLLQTGEEPHVKYGGRWSIISLMEKATIPRLLPRRKSCNLFTTSAQCGYFTRFSTQVFDFLSSKQPSINQTSFHCWQLNEKFSLLVFYKTVRTLSLMRKAAYGMSSRLLKKYHL